MHDDEVSRAITAVTATITEFGLAADEVVIVQNSTRLSLRILPCDLFARVAPESLTSSAAAELDLARKLRAVGAPVAALDPRVEPVVRECEGFAVTMWTHYDRTARDPLTDDDLAIALEQLHAGLRAVEVTAPHATGRVGEARRLVADAHRTPELPDADRTFLLDVLAVGHRAIARAAEHLLHGEPHAGNVLRTVDGPRFIDLETHCRGPVEFDIAHLPRGVADRYSGADAELIVQCRRLILALVAAWRWDRSDDYPDGRRHGLAVLDALHRGPPWPTLDEL